ncbi:Clp protease N-terminal domain-containing protein [Streptomyces coelicoflavus]|uniref:Clp protease N-terminal domain-containing protein n=1 Tax=Streptomyces TaxID=1883 RepID=UPI0013D94B8F|nr:MULTISPECIES: Clp protease N-terminal domain-containing protein [Streptomyces]KAF2777615.1 Clp amino domain-containing protein [Streptomyces sp. OM5714]MDI6518398.1 Clp protease N-terminal domain-containing protein [Streptomyces coelicoflavus]NHI07214.1 Clp amino domain-containing protein [Streptomyces sp. KO7888]
MFERFTKDARAVVQGAVEHAAEARAGTVEPEHLLLALLDREGSRASFALAALGVDEHRDAVRRELREVRRRAGLSQAETEALAGLGIDVSEIVARVEEAHGAGAMSVGDRKSGRRWSGHRSFSRGAKEVLEKALRVAVARRERHIGDEHLLLALAVRPGVPAEVLADHGVTHESLTRVLGDGGGQACA